MRRLRAIRHSAPNEGIELTAIDAFRPLFDAYIAAYRRGDALACADCYSEDGEILSPYGPPAKGRDALEALHVGWLAEGGEDKEIELLSGGVDGDLGWALTRFSEGNAGDAGVSLNVMKRGGDGLWRIRASSLTDE